jgi:hypothetical protein
MSAPIAPLLEHWHEFYTLVGTAAAALLALLFVATSLGVGILSKTTAGPTRTYMSPVAFHFTSALFVSTVALIPTHSRASVALVTGLNAAAGIGYSGFIVWRLWTDAISDLADRFAYGVAPLVAYLAGLLAAGLFAAGSRRAPEVLAGAVLLLLIVNIRNAWDLLLAMARRQGANQGRPTDTEPGRNV